MAGAGEPSAGRSLFGGAATALVPLRFADVSDIREVPDHQEVWADLAADCSLLLELVEPPAALAAAGPEPPAAFFWRDLAEAGGATSQSLLLSIGGVDPAAHAPALLASAERWRLAHPGTVPGSVGAELLSVSLAAGVQSLSKERGRDPREVLVLLAACRLPGVATDLLIVVNEPVAEAQLQTGDGGASARALAGAGLEWATGMPPAAVAVAAGHGGSSSSRPGDVLRRALATVAVLDWGLFG